MSIQAPPNLTPEPDDAAPPASSAAADSPAGGWRLLLDAGINDWGGVSPITRDWVSPEKPWPHLQRLAEATAATGKVLLPRLPVYPRYLQHHQLLLPRGGSQRQQSTSASSPPEESWLDGSAGAASLAAAALRLADSEGLARGSNWWAGAAEGAEEAAAGSLVDGAASTQQQQQQQQGSDGLKSSIPLVRRPEAERSWRVAVGLSGVMEGCQGPQEATQVVRALLHGVLEGAQELEEDEMELLLTGRSLSSRTATI